MGLGPIIVIMKELKAHVFNAKEKREIPLGPFIVIMKKIKSPCV
jgi:hypothetical protein